MWCIWKEYNQWTFENLDRSDDQLLALFSSFLFDWSRAWGLVSSDSLPLFLSSLFLFFFFLISNKTSLIIKKRHPSTQGVYKGEQIKNKNYKSQVNPKEKKNGFSTQRTIQVRFGKKEA